MNVFGFSRARTSAGLAFLMLFVGVAVPIGAKTLLSREDALSYGWMRYLCDPDTEFSVMNHPWQPHVQHAHLLVAPLLVGMVGHFWLQHIWPHWKSQLKVGRKTGVSLWILLIPMILSGYCIQVAVHPTTRLWWIWIHGVTSILWLCSYVGHTIIHVHARRPHQTVRKGGL